MNTFHLVWIVPTIVTLSALGLMLVLAIATRLDEILNFAHRALVAEREVESMKARIKYLEGNQR
jgi:uncharacterized metal-binding protein